MTGSRFVLSTLAVLAWSGVVHAQVLDKDADADRLFKEGQKLMEERRFAEACPKLESAYKKDQQLGTLLNLAYCHKEQGSTWVSWVEFREAESKATELKRNDRRDFAREKMRELEKNLAKLVIDPKPGVELAEVAVEDRRVFEAEKGVPFCAEANGQRKFTFHAKGKKPAVLLVNVGPATSGKVQHVTIPELVNDEGPPPGLLDTSSSARTEGPPPSGGERSSWSGMKTAAVIAGVVGLGGVAVGSVFGVKTITSGCADGRQQGDPCLPDERADVSNQAMISTIAFIAGGALVAGAVVLWIAAPSGKTSARAVVGPSWAGITGTF